jgi:hypothetical protein
MFVMYANTTSHVILQENEEHVSINFGFCYLYNVDDYIPWKRSCVSYGCYIHVKRILTSEHRS